MKQQAPNGGGERWFRLDHDPRSEEKGIILDGANHNNFRAWDFLSGSKISNWPRDARMRAFADCDRYLIEDHLMSFLPLVPVVSARAAACFEQHFGADVQLLPVALEVFGVAKGTWFILNGTKLIAAVDTERSTMRSGIATTVVIKEAAVPTDTRLFRIEGQPVRLMAHRKVRDVLMLEGLTGFGFLRP